MEKCWQGVMDCGGAEVCAENVVQRSLRDDLVPLFNRARADTQRPEGTT